MSSLKVAPSSLPCALALLLSLIMGTSTQAQSALKLTKVDPPNWWAAMPEPMLLVQGEDMSRATFSLSDKALRIEKTVISENGHWAQVWLAASPKDPESITIRASYGVQQASLPYTFAARRPATDGFAGFSSRDVMYLIMTDRFADGDASNDGPVAQSQASNIEALAERAKPRGWHGGDLRGIQRHLDYLQQLGVTAVWTTPVYQNHESSSYHGYGATDLYAVDEHYGTLDDLKSLAAALHARGMKLVLDTVPNHIGPAHPWVKDEPAPDWFHGTAAHHLKAETNFRALIDPHAPERDRTATLDGWFADTLPDMDTESPAVSQYLRQNAIWWIEETSADALRIDTFPYVNRAFWHDFNGDLKQLYPHLTEVGEAFNGDPTIVSSFADEVTRAGVDTRLYTPFDFPTYFALRDVFTKDAPVSKLAEVLAQDPLYPHPERLVPFFGNHDTTRFATAASSGTALQLAFAYILTTRGMPQIYSGDEIAMTGGEDPDNRQDFPGGFLDNNSDAFTAKGRTPEQQKTFAWASALIALRKQHEALQCGAEQVLAATDDWMVYLRDGGHAGSGTCGASKDRVMIAMHHAAKAQTNAPVTLDVTLKDTWMQGCRLAHPEIVLAGSSAVADNDLLHLQAQGDGVLVASCH